jgi:hypothetical protein
MSNATILQRMSESCDEFENREIRPADFGVRIVGLAEALEGIRHSAVERAREFELELLGLQEDLDDGVPDDSEFASVLSSVKTCLQQLSANPPKR